MEVSGEMYAGELASEVPATRVSGLLVPEGDEIRYYPATK
jgi:hypothetical protein